MSPPPTAAEHGDEVARWQALLAAAVAPLRHLHRVVVRVEVDSTMDEVRRLGMPPGLVATCLRQRTGRGREGRAWIDRGEGIALTAVVEAATLPRAGELALAAAVAAAECVERIRPQVRAGIKWPNDVEVAQRKVAGVLVERLGGVAAIGIGLNVLQQAFPQEIAARATSLLQLGGALPERGGPLDRAAVAAVLLQRLDGALALSWSDLRAAWCARDLLRGRGARIRVGAEIVEGVVRSIEPLEWIEVEVPGASALRRIPAEIATILDFERGDGR